MPEPRYKRFDLIIEVNESGPNHPSRRWEIIDVSSSEYLVRPLFSGGGGGRFNWWEHADAERLTCLQGNGGQFGVVCHCGDSYLPPATCRRNH